MNALDDIFGGLIITPEQRMRLRNHEAEFRTAMREEVADETRKADQADKLNASLTRLEISQRNHNLMAQIEAHRQGGSE